MNRFFYHVSQRQEQSVVLQGEDAHHLSRVLRARAGDLLELCDNHGLCHTAVISFMEKNRIQCTLTDKLASNESGTKVDLAFGLLKGEKTDFVLQKATELGANRFLPFFSERTVVKGSMKETARTERRQKIVWSAAAQSHRSVVPAVGEPYTWDEIIEGFTEYDLVLLFWEDAKNLSLKQAMQDVKLPARVLVITGPEGGISENEAAAAYNAGAKLLTLGPRILRAETAAITAVALTLYQAGEMGGY